MIADWYPIIRRFLDSHAVTRPGVTVGSDGRPCFRDWQARGLFASWLARCRYEFDGAGLPPPGPR